MSNKEAELMRATLDLMAVALTEHDHVWTDEERQMYEKAIRIVRRYL